MKRVGVVGPGAIGGTLAAWLSEVESNRVTIFARTGFDRLLVTVPGGGTLESRPVVVTDVGAASVMDSEITGMDWVVVATKTYDVEGASTWLRKIVGPDTRVAVVQNGVEHRERFRGVVEDARVLPVIIDIPAERIANGEIVQHRHGDITAPAGELGREFAALFAGTPLTPILSDDFSSASWRKLTFNSCAIINALTGKPAGLVRDEKSAVLMQAIATECLAVGRAVGATLADSLPEEAIARYRASAPNAVNSFLADRLAGRTMEIDARNGVIERLGAAHGIPTPLNAMAVTLLEAIAARSI